MASSVVLLTGAGGLLGQAVQKVAADWPVRLVALTRAQLDIADLAAVEATLARVQPDVVVNAAAYTNVDGAEREPVAALRANTLGPATLATATAASGAALVQVSTDHVFGGGAEIPYGEEDPTDPQSIYGRSKRDGEEWVRVLQPRHWIVRTAGLFGPGGRNFIAAIVSRAQRDGQVRVVADQTCSRTYSRDLAAGVLELITRGVAFGTYHVTNAGWDSWYGFAQAVLAQAGIPASVEPTTTAEWSAPAWRPAWSVLCGARWAAAGLTPLRGVEAAVAAYLGTMGLAPRSEEVADG